jgi:hypothetical protein
MTASRTRKPGSAGPSPDFHPGKRKRLIPDMVPRFGSNKPGKPDSGEKYDLPAALHSPFPYLCLPSALAPAAGFLRVSGFDPIFQ